MAGNRSGCTVSSSRQFTTREFIYKPAKHGYWCLDFSDFSILPSSPIFAYVSLRHPCQRLPLAANSPGALIFNAVFSCLFSPIERQNWEWMWSWWRL